jgi:hypothetical protein
MAALVFRGMRLPAEVWDMLRKHADDQDVNLADVVREAVLGYLDEHGYDVSPFEATQLPRYGTGRRFRTPGKAAP